MTDQLRKAAEMALGALEAHADFGIKADKAIEALRQALAQPEQEPVAYLDAVDNKTVYVAPVRKRWLDPHQDKEWKQFHCDHQYDTPLHTAPPSKPWVSLTDGEIQDFGYEAEKFDKSNSEWFDRFGFARAIEAALKDKNNGN